jgi:membrane associated rhomboid family serine protease
MNPYTNSNNSNDANERPPNPYLNPTPPSAERYPSGETQNPYAAGNGYNNPYVTPPQAESSYKSNPYAQPFSNPYSGSYYGGAQNPYNAPYQQQPAYDPNEQRRVLMGTRFNAQPLWTYIFLGVIAAVFFGQMALGGVSGRIDPIAQWGAAIKSQLQDGEFWRIVTPIFIHFGIVHFLFNMVALFSFGVELERLYGQVRYILIFFLTGIFGNLLTMFMDMGDRPVIAAGASGSLFGLLGAMIAFYYRNRDTLGWFGNQNLRSLLFVAGLNVLITFSIPGIGIWAHMGGLASGFFLGYFLSPFQIKRTIGKGAEAVAVRSKDFVNLWWPAGATFAALVVMYLAIMAA